MVTRARNRGDDPFSDSQTAPADSPEASADTVVVLNWLDELKRRVPTHR